MMSKSEPKYTLANSVEEMLLPETISAPLGRGISQVSCRPFESSKGFSGNQLFHVEADGHKLVMKRLRPSVDWIAMATDDHLCRSVRVWQFGLLDRTLPHMKHGILAACQDGAEYALLMQDVSKGLIPFNSVLTHKTIVAMLDALAALHATFWEDEALNHPELGLAKLESLVSFGWPSQWHRYPHAETTLAMLRQGWEVLFELLEPDVRDALQSIMQRPQPLFDALAKFPATLAHGDYRLDNLAHFPASEELVVFDWQFASYAPATICMCWFVMSMSGNVTRGDAMSSISARRQEYFWYYHQKLFEHLGARFDQSLWQPMLDLGSVVEVLRKGNWHALFSVTGDEEEKAYMRRSVDTYNDVVRKGLTWL